MGQLSNESVIATRQWFADNAKACIDEALSSDIRVNDLESYIEWQRELATAAMLGYHDHTFTFRQRAWFIQTGECVALLP